MLQKCSYEVGKNENRQREKNVQRKKSEGNERKDTKMWLDSSTK